MFNTRLAKDYLLYRLKAKTRHGLHSPFVYRLVDKVIYDYSAKKVYTEIENIAKSLSATGRNGATPKKIAQLLYRLVANWQPHNIIEIRRGQDDTSIYLQKAAPDAKTYNVNSKEQLISVIENLDQLDCIFIKEGDFVYEYFELCLPKVHDGTMLVVDDIYRTEDAKQAWAQIKANPQITATVDLFWIGLVYFRKGQVKEDFVIKI